MDPTVVMADQLVRVIVVNAIQYSIQAVLMGIVVYVAVKRAVGDAGV